MKLDVIYVEKKKKQTLKIIATTRTFIYPIPPLKIKSCFFFLIQNVFRP